MWVIDGYNVIFARRDPGEKFDPRELERERDLLVSLLSRYVAAKSGRAVVVFDGEQGAGRPPASRPGDRVEVIFSTGRGGADDAIVGLVMHARGPGVVTVVTGDLEISRAVTKLGAAVVGAAEFLREVDSALRRSRGRTEDEPIEKTRGISAGEVDEWMKIFGHPKDPDLEDKR